MRNDLAVPTTTMQFGESPRRNSRLRPAHALRWYTAVSTESGCFTGGGAASGPAPRPSGCVTTAELHGALHPHSTWTAKAGVPRKTRRIASCGADPRSAAGALAGRRKCKCAERGVPRKPGVCPTSLIPIRPALLFLIFRLISPLSALMW